MKYPAHFEITTSEGVKVPLLFNSWMFRKFCQFKKMELEDLMDGIRFGKAFKMADLPDLLLIAAETFCRFNGTQFVHTDLDATLWVDDLGGYNSKAMGDIYIVFVAKLLNVSPEKLMVEVSGKEEEQEEKPSKKKKVTA